MSVGAPDHVTESLGSVLGFEKTLAVKYHIIREVLRCDYSTDGGDELVCKHLLDIINAGEELLRDESRVSSDEIHFYHMGH